MTDTDPSEIDHADEYINPNLTVTSHPHRGRHVLATAAIPADTLLVRAAPYATVPARCPSPRICARPSCHRRIDASPVLCPHNCADSVAWCAAACRAADAERHALECAWLAECRVRVPRKVGVKAFQMLWLLVRVLARRAVEGEGTARGTGAGAGACVFLRCGWDGVVGLVGNEERMAEEQMRLYEELVRRYVVPFPALMGRVGVGGAVALFCKAEMNLFGLCRTSSAHDVGAARDDGRCGGQGGVDGRECYATGLYPAGSLFNHSCSPNVSKEPDGQGRMVFRAARSIGEGEECCVSYVDLDLYREVQERKEYLADIWAFECACSRCQQESSVS